MSNTVYMVIPFEVLSNNDTKNFGTLNNIESLIVDSYRVVCTPVSTEINLKLLTFPRI